MTGHTLVIRADADAAQGAGHVMRCLALAQAWAARGGSVRFLGASGSLRMAQRISALGFDFWPVQSVHPAAGDLESTLETLRVLRRRGNAVVLVADGYHFSADYHSVVRADGCPLLVIDDVAHLPWYHADVLVNQNLGADGLAYRCSPETRRLFGPRYALLRREFEEWRAWRRSIPAVGRRVLVTLGGADVGNAAAGILRAMRGLPLRDLEIAVAVGPLNPHLNALEEEARELGGSVRILKGIDDVATLMAWADLAIAAAGTTSWELAYMGLPSLVGIAADNQVGIATELSTHGLAMNLGWFSHLTESRLIEALMALLTDGEQRREVSERGRKFVDGAGADRVAAELYTLVGQSVGPRSC